MPIVRPCFVNRIATKEDKAILLILKGLHDVTKPGTALKGFWKLGNRGSKVNRAGLTRIGHYASKTISQTISLSTT